MRCEEEKKMEEEPIEANALWRGNENVRRADRGESVVSESEE